MSQNHSQPVLSDFNNLYYLVVSKISSGFIVNDSSIITPPKLLEIQENTQTEIDVTLTPSLTLNTKSYTPNLTSQSLFLSYSVSSKESLEQTILSKFQRIEEVEKIYILFNGNLVLVKIVLDMPTYGYDLMQRIFTEAEFPIKDSYLDKIIDFEYLPKESTLPFEEYKLLLDKELIDMSFSSNFNYGELFEAPNNPHFLWQK